MSDCTEANRALIEAAFVHWRAGEGDFFDLLTDDCVWTIAGSSWPAGTYRGRDPYLAAAVTPLFSRLAAATVPTDVRLLADGNQVVVRWSQATPLKGGGIYCNDYAWFLTLANERVTEVAAFLDKAAYVAATSAPVPDRMPE